MEQHYFVHQLGIVKKEEITKKAGNLLKSILTIRNQDTNPFSDPINIHSCDADWIMRYSIEKRVDGLISVFIIAVHLRTENSR